MTAAARNGSQPDRPRWILIPNWEKFQHYHDRHPPWLKVYIELLDKDEYLTLPPGTRGVLHGLWLLYARTRGVLRADPKRLSSALGASVYRSQLERLNHAGFIRLVASKPVAHSYTLARSRRVSPKGDTKKGASAPALTAAASAPKKTRRGDREPKLLKERT